MMVTEDRKIRVEMDKMRADIKRIKDLLELSDRIDPVNWPDLTDLDRRILQQLLAAGFEGKTSVDLARLCGLQKPETSGRVQIWQRLKQINRISYRRTKGGEIVVQDRGRVWRMNWEDFSFVGVKRPGDRGELVAAE